jgi:hypothetical protein
MFLFPEGHGLNEKPRPRIRPTTPEFGSTRTPHLCSTVPNVQRHMAYFALCNPSCTPRAHGHAHEEEMLKQPDKFFHHQGFGRCQTRLSTWLTIAPMVSSGCSVTGNSDKWTKKR